MEAFGITLGHRAVWWNMNTLGKGVQRRLWRGHMRGPGADGSCLLAREARAGALVAAEVITVDVWYGCSIIGVWTR